MATYKSLAVLSDDVLGIITAMIADQDIGALWMTGDLGLKKRMENGGVKVFAFERGTRRSSAWWPQMVSHFLGLRSFRFIGATSNKLAALTTPQLITSREIDALPAGLLELVFSGEVKLSRSSVSLIVARFPGIHSLDLCAPLSHLEESFSKLDFLVNLRLVSSGSCEEEPFVTLPTALNRLELRGMSFKGSLSIPHNVLALKIVSSQQSAPFERPLLTHLDLPPQLTTLSYSTPDFGPWVHHPEKLWSTLPKTLTKVRFLLHRDVLTPSLLSLLPRSLLHLRLDCVNNSAFVIYPDHIKALPPRIESLDLGPIFTPHWPSDGFDVFPSTLRSLKSVASRNGLKALKSLTELECCGSFYPADVPFELPPSLLIFRSPQYSFHYKLDDLPASLTKVRTNLDGPYREAPRRVPPNLTSARFYIPTTGVLQYLPPRMTKLKVVVNSEAFSNEKEAWSAHLPKSLTYLAVRAFVTHEWFSHLPNVKTLIVFTETSARMTENVYRLKPINHECLPLVPHSVTNLLLQFNSFPLTSLAFLRHHRLLQMLVIESASPMLEAQECIPWKSLPKSLGLVHFRFPNFKLVDLTQDTNGIEVKLLKGNDPRMLF